MNNIISKIKVVLDDITTLKVDCIVNAANETLLGGGGVDGAIHRAAGPKLKEECAKLKGCKTGQAKITKGYNLPAKYVIHTVGPVYEQRKANEKKQFLIFCYLHTLNLAKENNIHSIAFPSISTGTYGYPHKEACDVAWVVVWNWLVVHDNYDLKVTFCCYDQETFDLYNKKFLHFKKLKSIM